MLYLRCFHTIRGVVMRLVSVLFATLLTACSHAQVYPNPDVYHKRHTQTVISRSVFYAPAWGGLYKEKWEEVVARDPNVRAVAVHLHGCAGLTMFEKNVADFYIHNLGIAVITPDFVARPGNFTGCPGRGNDDMLEGGKRRFQEGVYTARNPNRMSARTDEVEHLVSYIKSITNKPIFLSGHSEGARTVYHYNIVDKQIVGAILHNQACNTEHSHIFRMPTTYKTFQIIENNDPWASGSADCSHHFKGRDSNNITVLRQQGRNHRPLQNDEAKRELKIWVDNILGGSWTYKPTHNEELLPQIQQKIANKLD